MPSADGMLKSLIAAGVPSQKLGIGIAFYAWIWSGGSGTSTGGTALPRQSWSTAPSTSQVSYNTLMNTYFSSNIYRWDNSAQAAYLTIDQAGGANDQFISYDDARACQAKVSYARNNSLGGVMIWELAQDHQGVAPDPLLAAIKRAFAWPGAVSITNIGHSVDLSFTNMPLGSYRVLWTSNIAAPQWSTLLTTNSPGAEGILHVSAPVVPNARFYRVQSPP